MAFDEWKYENERNDYQKRSYLESNANIEFEKKSNEIEWKSHNDNLQLKEK